MHRQPHHAGDAFPGNRHHGYSASPALIDGKFLVLKRTLRAYDAQDGKLVWEQKPKYLTWGSLVPARVGGQPVVLTAEGSAFRVADGAPVWRAGAFGSHKVPTPIVEGDVVYAFDDRGFGVFPLPGGLDADARPKPLWRIKLDRELDLGVGIAAGFVTSPLYCEGLLYLVSPSGVLTVLDARTGGIVCSRELDLIPPVVYVSRPGVSASPTLAGKHIYIFDNTNTAVV